MAFAVLLVSVLAVLISLELDVLHRPAVLKTVPEMAIVLVALTEKCASVFQDGQEVIVRRDYALLIATAMARAISSFRLVMEAARAIMDGKVLDANSQIVPTTAVVTPVI